MINEKREQKRDVSFAKKKKEEAKEFKAETSKREDVRRDHLVKTKQKYQSLDNAAHRAGKEHHKAVD